MTQMEPGGRRWKWNPLWGWGAFAAVVVLVIALVFVSGQGTQTTGTDTSPPATTGQGSTTPPASGR
jgi:hypothetical protein